MGSTCAIDPAVSSDKIFGLRVLLAEDNIVNQKVAVNILRRLGCEVEAVPNGRLAVEAVIQGGYDLVLMDIQMPELDGLAATAAIRQLPSPQRSLPIIAVTANAMQGDREICLGAGMDDFLPKPVTSAGLLAMLIKWDARSSTATSPIPMQSDTPIFDPAPLDEAFGEDVEFVWSVLGEYTRSATEQLKAIGAAHASADANALERAAHTLKGSSRTVGAMRMASVAADLETCGRTGDLAKVAPNILRLRDEYLLLAQELDNRRPAA